nr:alpha-1,2-fucosyltransferase [uncultured Macellibacteroides sp.]
MIYVILSGRLGNNLFQIATVSSLTKDFSFCLINDDQIKQVERYRDSIFKNIKTINGIPENIKYYKEPSFEYNKIPYIHGEDLIIDGYFQSEKYFKREIVLNLLKIPNNIRRDILNNYGDLLKKEVVSIHVRRGDYLKLPHALPFCGIKYYLKAIQYIGSDKVFLVCSDDIKWCKKNFKKGSFIFVENSSPLNDLYLQSLCSHNIISNSSFSWWGAWLNENPNKIVIAPQTWFGLSIKLKTDDLIPETWIRIPNNYSIGRYLFAQYKIIEDSIFNIIRNSFIYFYIKRYKKHTL